MKSSILIMFVLPVLLFPIFSPNSSAAEIQSDYASISYATDDMLETFNNSLFIGRFSFFFKKKKAITVEDDVRNKIDMISMKAEKILEMYPPNLHYAMELCKDTEKVGDLYKARYSNPGRDILGFYYPPADTVYVSARDAELRVVAHEIGHVVIDKYFRNRPPVKIHELLAQFVEAHITD